ncbi:acyl-CoA dehydrogenase [Streptomyces kaniharaensis]|uniref:Acyl-CoA dehydrogenase n=1 Tax=Streptomyces kaniharaensis TaxID=212423 RepID=A0A6N7KTZ5_9ACTN|nr:acyl-CoA dehydrogenase [Streptomyces kaniharaensis]MQS14901.1 acyl-CoA dehydrogenase [Streptomyces kaniharaensis]
MVTALLAPTTRPAPTAAARAAELEARLGDPGDPGNPLGFAALLRADEQARRFDAGEDALDGFGGSAEFVPVELGGRLDSVPGLVEVMRPVFRRDVALGMGYGMTSYMAASDVWTEGTPEQQARLAKVLLAGGRAAIAQPETTHSNDYVRSQVTARRVADGLLLSGGKPAINNLDRAEALVLFCRTDPEPGSRSLSALLFDPRELPLGRARTLPRHLAVGLRGCRFAGLEFDDCPLPDGALLGPPGSGIEAALRSFHLSRTVMSALAVGAVDTVLRTAAGFDQSHRPNGWGAARASAARTDTAVAGAFVNVLLYDSFAAVALRALHLLPEQTSVYSAALKYLMPRVLIETMYELSTVLGSGIYAREGSLGIFQKHLRDVPVLSLGHAGTVACQATVIPQLPWLARRSWFAEEPAPAGLFRLRDPLPPLRTERLSLACDRDSVSAELLAGVAEEAAGRGRVLAVLRELVALLAEQFRELREQVLELEEHPAAREVAGFALVDRYALLLAGASVLGVWRHAQGGDDPFLADPSWAAAALHKVARRLTPKVPALPPECEARILQEVRIRFSARHSYDLWNTPVSG